MALSTTEVLYNEALGIIGETLVTEGNTSTKQYVSCDMFYAQARDEVLALHPWNEAVEDVIIARDATPPLIEYKYRYAIPSDSLKVMSISITSPQWDWQVKGDYVVTDLQESPDGWKTATAYYDGQFLTSNSVTYEVLVSHTSDTIANDVVAGNLVSAGGDYSIINMTYIKQLTDITKYSPRLKYAIAMKLAIKILPRMHNDPSAKRELINEFESLVMPQARSVDAQQGKARPIYNSQHIRSRG